MPRACAKACARAGLRRSRSSSTQVACGWPVPVGWSGGGGGGGVGGGWVGEGGGGAPEQVPKLAGYRDEETPKFFEPGVRQTTPGKKKGGSTISAGGHSASARRSSAGPPAR